MNAKNLRILLLGDSRSFHIERYVPELRRQNCEILLASIEEGAIEHYQFKRLGPIRQFHYSLAVPALKRLISTYLPEIIDVQDANYGYMAALALKHSPIPLNLQILGSDILIVPHKSFVHRWKTSFALRRADAVVADSQYLLNEAMKLANLKLSLVEPFGIEEKYLRLHKQDYTVFRPLRIIVPRLQDKVYNNFFIVKSLTAFLKAGSIVLTFADFGRLAKKFKSAVQSLNCPNIRFYQRSDRDTFMKLMSEHDVYLSASLSDSSPVSLIESMALGLIPVAARIPGIKEWAEDSGAFTFTKDNSNELSGLIRNIIDDNLEHTDMRIRNLAKVKQRALFENNVVARINIMKKLIGRI